MEVLARKWGWVALRGVAAIGIGLFALSHPGLGFVALLLLFGGYAFLDGLVTVIVAIATRHRQPRWWALLLAGIAGMMMGAFTLGMMRLAAFVLVRFIAVWAILAGITGILSALALRKAIVGEWLLGLAGAASVFFGLMLVVVPGLGAISVVLFSGAFACIVGVILLVLAFQLRSWGKRLAATSQTPAA